MFTVIVISVISVVVALIAYWNTQPKIHQDGRKLLKPPNTLPILGNAIIFLQARHKLFHWFAQCQCQYGYQTLEISVPTLPPGVIISSPENLEFVLKHDEIFTKGEFFKSRSWDLFGNGIINVDGPLWKTQRKAALRFFSNASLQTLVDVHLPVFVDETRSQLSKAAAEKKIIDLEAVFADFTTRLMGKLAYDIDMKSSSTFFQSFDLASGAIGERFQNPFWRITEPLFGSKLYRALSEVKDFGASIVHKTLEKREYHLLHGQPSVPKKDQKPEAGTSQRDGYLINALLANIRDPKLVADSALNFLSAGRDTTAQALTWTFHLLMRHPATILRIQTELSTLPLSTTNTTTDSPTTPTSPKNRTTNPSSPNPTSTTTTPPPINLTSATLTPTTLPYIHAVFNESLRLYPPVPFEIKQTTRPTTLPDHTHLPANAVVVWCPWAMGRSTKTWGDDAMLFKPERWLCEEVETLDMEEVYESLNDGNAGNDGKEMEEEEKEFGEKKGVGEMGKSKWRRRVKLIPRSAFEFPVFNGGPRMCMGKKMAELMAVYMISTLVSEFEFSEEFDSSKRRGLHGGGGGGGAAGGDNAGGGVGGEGGRAGGGDEADAASTKERKSRNSLTLPMEGGLPCHVSFVRSSREKTPIITS